MKWVASHPPPQLWLPPSQPAGPHWLKVTVHSRTIKCLNNTAWACTHFPNSTTPQRHFFSGTGCWRVREERLTSNSTHNMSVQNGTCTKIDFLYQINTGHEDLKNEPEGCCKNGWSLTGDVCFTVFSKQTKQIYRQCFNYMLTIWPSAIQLTVRAFELL